MTEDADWDHLASAGHLISRIARGLTRIGDARLRDLGFTTAHLPILRALESGARLSQGDLARWARVEQPTMAQMLARMEREGIIRRDPDATDRRSSLVSLTDAARAKLPAGRAVLRRSNEEMMHDLAPAEVTTLIALLRRVLSNTEAMQAKMQGTAGPNS